MFLLFDKVLADPGMSSINTQLWISSKCLQTALTVEAEAQGEGRVLGCHRSQRTELAPGSVFALL